MSTNCIRRMAKVVSIIVLATSLSACAYIIRGSKQTYYINTKPQNAKVTLSNGITCKTPCKLKLKRKKEFTVTIEKPGYHTYTTVVTSSINAKGAGLMSGNVIIAGGLPGAAIDAGTGAAYRLKPNPLLIKLVRKPEGFDKAASQTSAPPRAYYSNVPAQ